MHRMLWRIRWRAPWHALSVLLRNASFVLGTFSVIQAKFKLTEPMDKYTYSISGLCYTCEHILLCVSVQLHCRILSQRVAQWTINSRLEVEHALVAADAFCCRTGHSLCALWHEYQLANGHFSTDKRMLSYHANTQRYYLFSWDQHPRCGREWMEWTIHSFRIFFTSNKKRNRNVGRYSTIHSVKYYKNDYGVSEDCLSTTENSKAMIFAYATYRTWCFVSGGSGPLALNIVHLAYHAMPFFSLLTFPYTRGYTLNKPILASHSVLSVVVCDTW